MTASAITLPLDLVSYPTAAETMQAARVLHGENGSYLEEGVYVSLDAHLASAQRMADILHRDFSVSPGDRVAVMASTSRGYIALWHAAILGHFIIVPLNVRLTPTELHPILINAEPAVLIHDEDHRELAAKVCDRQEPPLAHLRIEDLLAADCAPSYLVPPPKPDDVAAIVYTTGTTGTPKGVAMTQAALARTADRQHSCWDLTSPETKLYTTTPLFHVSGIFAIFGPSLYGNLTVVVPRFDVDQLLADSRTLKLTHFAVVATMVQRFIDHPEFRAEEHNHIRGIVYGGSPIPAPTIDKMRRLLPRTGLMLCYGMSETIGVCTSLLPEDHRAGGPRLLSCGRVLPGVEVIATDSDGRRCAPRETGELTIRSDGLMQCYWRNPEGTRAAMREQWYLSGDAGFVDEDGYVYVVDRIKDMILTGGENVYSVEVERAIARLPGVAEVAVIGVPSEAWGEAVWAVVVPMDEAALDPHLMRKTLKEDLADYKCPKRIIISDEPLPLVGNKIDKVALRKRFAADISVES